MALSIEQVVSRCTVGEIYQCVSSTFKNPSVFKPGNRYEIIDTPVLGPGLSTEFHTEVTQSWVHTGSSSKFKKVK